MVGILSGAYSSIFIAAPLLTIWKEREPEYARRIGQDSPSGDAAEAAIEDDRGSPRGRRACAGSLARRSGRPPGAEPARRSASAGGSGDARGPMAAPAELRELAEKLVARRCRRGRADGRAGGRARRGAVGARRHRARGGARVDRGGWSAAGAARASGSSEWTGWGSAALFRELGLVTRVELEELELRVAQIEHRLRLLEAVNPLRLARQRRGGVVVRPPDRAASRGDARAGRWLRRRARPARGRRRGRGEPLLGDRPSADRRVLAAAALLPREGRAVRDPGARHRS